MKFARLLFASLVCIFAMSNINAYTFAESADAVYSETVESAETAEVQIQHYNKSTPETGVESVAVVMGAAVVSGAIMVLTSKKQK